MKIKSQSDAAPKPGPQASNLERAALQGQLRPTSCNAHATRSDLKVKFCQAIFAPGSGRFHPVHRCEAFPAKSQLLRQALAQQEVCGSWLPLGGNGLPFVLMVLKVGARSLFGGCLACVRNTQCEVSLDSSILVNASKARFMKYDLYG